MEGDNPADLLAILQITLTYSRTPRRRGNNHNYFFRILRVSLCVPRRFA
jgi:hypothetical protein